MQRKVAEWGSCLRSCVQPARGAASCWRHGHDARTQHPGSHLGREKEFEDRDRFCCLQRKCKRVQMQWDVKLSCRPG